MHHLRLSADALTKARRRDDARVRFRALPGRGHGDERAIPSRRVRIRRRRRFEIANDGIPRPIDARRLAQVRLRRLARNFAAARVSRHSSAKTHTEPSVRENTHREAKKQKETNHTRTTPSKSLALAGRIVHDSTLANASSNSDPARARRSPRPVVLVVLHRLPRALALVLAVVVVIRASKICIPPPVSRIIRRSLRSRARLFARHRRRARRRRRRVSIPPSAHAHESRGVPLDVPRRHVRSRATSCPTTNSTPATRAVGPRRVARARERRARRRRRPGGVTVDETTTTTTKTRDNGVIGVIIIDDAMTRRARRRRADDVTDDATTTMMTLASRPADASVVVDVVREARPATGTGGGGGAGRIRIRTTTTTTTASDADDDRAGERTIVNVTVVDDGRGRGRGRGTADAGEDARGRRGGTPRRAKTAKTRRVRRENTDERGRDRRSYRRRLI